MEFSCLQCATRYRAADEKIPPRGGKVRCPKCEAFIVIAPGTVALASDNPPRELEMKRPEEISSEETVETASDGSEREESEPIAPPIEASEASPFGEGEEMDFLSASLSEEEEPAQEAGPVAGPPPAQQEEPLEEVEETPETPVVTEEAKPVVSEGTAETPPDDAISPVPPEQSIPMEVPLLQQTEEEGMAAHLSGFRVWAQRFKDRLPGRRPIRRILLGGLAAAFLAGLAVVLWQYVPVSKPQRPASKTASSAPQQSPIPSPPPGSSGQSIPAGKEPVIIQPPESLPVTPEGPLYPLQPFLIPLTSGSQEDRFLKVTMALELSGGEVSLEIDDKLTKVREQILAVLISRTLSSFLDPQGKSQLRNDLIGSINRQLSTGRIRNLYFTEFVIL